MVKTKRDVALLKHEKIGFGPLDFFTNVIEKLIDFYLIVHICHLSCSLKLQSCSLKLTPGSE